MIHPPKKTELVDRSPDTRMLGPTFDPAYVEGAVKSFFLSSKYEGEPPLLPMIDVALGKEAASPPQQRVEHEDEFESMENYEIQSANYYPDIFEFL